MHIRIDLSSALGLLAAALLAGTAACGGPQRTAAATQPTPAAFDPSQSDQQALDIVDATITAVGGAEAWAQVKQIQWQVKYYQNDALAAWFKHAWDQWNGRHRFEMVRMESYEIAQQSGNEEDMQWIVAMYDLFDRSARAVALFDGQAVMPGDREKIVSDAYEQWQLDSYQLSMVHKLRDPGVILNYVGETQERHGKCLAGCVLIKVSFAPEVGTDTYVLNISKETNLPEIVEQHRPEGIRAYAYDEWTEAGGLKFPSKLSNLGGSEVIEIEEVVIGEPDDALYRAPIERQLTRAGEPRPVTRAASGPGAS